MPNGKTVVYTAIFGDKDPLRDPRIVEDGVDYICYTDSDLKSDIWKVIHCEDFRYEDPCRKAKEYKLQPHVILKEYKRSIWVDGNVEIMNPLTPLFDEMKSDLGFFKHPTSSEICIYREACDCIRKKYDDADLIVETISRYKAEKHPENWGLPMGRFILRNHTQEVANFNDWWWKEIEKGTRRDQISLPVVLRRMGIKYDDFNPHRLYNIYNLTKWNETQLIKLHNHTNLKPKRRIRRNDKCFET